jgi:hypothetical protein
VYEAGDPGNLHEAATYLARSEDWAPENASMESQRYDRLRRGIERRQLLVAWGTGGRGRRPRPSVAGNVSGGALRVGRDLVAAHAHLVTRVRAKHAKGETSRWDEVEQQLDMKVDLVFDLGVANETDTGYVVNTAIREVQDATRFKSAAAVEALSIGFLALGLRGDEYGRGSLVDFFAVWLRTPLVDVRAPRPTTRRPTARFSFRLSDGPPHARGDCSQLDIVLESLAQAMLVLRSRDTARALELLAVTHLASVEHHEGGSRPCTPERRALILASLRRTLRVAPPREETSP